MIRGSDSSNRPNSSRPSTVAFFPFCRLRTSATSFAAHVPFFWVPQAARSVFACHGSNSNPTDSQNSMH